MGRVRTDTIDAYASTQQGAPDRGLRFPVALAALERNTALMLHGGCF